MIRIEVTVEIERPADEVFAYLTEAHNLPEWLSPLIEVKHTDPPGLGAKTTMVGKPLGRRIETALHEFKRDLEPENSDQPRA